MVEPKALSMVRSSGKLEWAMKIKLLAVALVFFFGFLVSHFTGFFPVRAAGLGIIKFELGVASLENGFCMVGLCIEYGVEVHECAFVIVDLFLALPLRR